MSVIKLNIVPLSESELHLNYETKGDRIKKKAKLARLGSVGAGTLTGLSALTMTEPRDRLAKGALTAGAGLATYGLHKLSKKYNKESKKIKNMRPVSVNFSSKD